MTARWVETDPQLFPVVEDMVKFFGLDIEHAFSVKEALDKLAGERHGIILLDSILPLQMPRSELPAMPGNQIKLDDGRQIPDPLTPKLTGWFVLNRYPSILNRTIVLSVVNHIELVSNGFPESVRYVQKRQLAVGHALREAITAIIGPPAHSPLRKEP